MATSIAQFSSPASLAASTLHRAAKEDLEEGPKTSKPPSAKADRRAAQRHLVEISAAQQRQQHLLEQQKKNKPDRAISTPIMQHPPPFDGSLDRERCHDPARRGFSAHTVRSVSHLSSASHSSSSIGRVQSAKSFSVTNTSLSIRQSTPTSLTPATAKCEEPSAGAGLDSRATDEGLTLDGAKAYKEMQRQSKQVLRKGKLRGVGRQHSETSTTRQNLDRKVAKIPHHSAELSNGVRQRVSMTDILPTPASTMVTTRTSPNQVRRTASHHAGFTPSSTKTSSPNSTTVQNNQNNSSLEVTLDIPDNRLNMSFLQCNQQRRMSNSSATHPEINDTIRSYNEIREALLDPVKRANLSPTTGDFIEHFVRKTDKEVAAITAEEKLHDELNGFLGEQLDCTSSVDINSINTPRGTTMTTSQNPAANARTAAAYSIAVGAAQFSLPPTSGTDALRPVAAASPGKNLFIKGHNETLYPDSSQQRSIRGRNERQSHHFLAEEESERLGSGVPKIYMNSLARRPAKQSAHHSWTLAPPSYMDCETFEDLANGRTSPPLVVKELPLPKPLEFDRGRSAYSQRKTIKNTRRLPQVKAQGSTFRGSTAMSDPRRYSARSQIVGEVNAMLQRLA